MADKKLGKMFRRLTQNLSIKIFCFLAAVFLWIYVSASQSTIGKFPSSLKVKTINVPSGLVAIYDTKTVNVKIMAEPSIWKKLSADSFSAYLDLSSYSKGTYEVPISVICSTPGVQIIEKDPNKILISLEPISSKDVNINRKIEGSAAEGLATGNVDLSPDHVQVRGAKSVIDNLTEATVVIGLNGETEGFKKVVPVVAFDDTGEVINGIEFTPPEVEANISIVKASNNRSVGVKVKTIGTPKTGNYISNVTVLPNVVDVTGPQTILSEVGYVETFAIDLSNLTGVVEKDVSLNVPNGLALQSGNNGKVHVKINISPLDISKEFLVPISFDNLDSSLKITAITPNQVKTILSGSEDIIGGLKSSDMRLTLDLKNKGAGIYSFDINSDNFQLPANVSFLTSLPSAITVNVEKK